MDGAHTHGPSGGDSMSIVPIVVGIGILVLAGPVIVGALLELVHILVIILATVIAVAGAGAVGLLWWRFHKYQLPPWKRAPQQIRTSSGPHRSIDLDGNDALPDRRAYLAITQEQLEEVIKRAIEGRGNGR